MYQGSEQHKSNFLKAAALGKLAQEKLLCEKRAIYYANPKRCLQCEAPIPYEKKAANRFCKKSCSAAYNNRSRGSRPEETREKISKSTKETLAKKVRLGLTRVVLVDKVCVFCNGCFSVRKAKKQQIFCSVSCKRKHHKTNEAAVQKARATGRANVQKQMLEGRWKGWSGQSLGKRSFPEHYVEQLLVKAGVTHYEFQHQVARFSLDFAFIKEKMVLEVDGKQHLTPKGKAHDEKRDAFLRENGWEVFRLTWVSVRSEAGKRRVEQALTEFLEVLRSRKVVALEK